MLLYDDEIQYSTGESLNRNGLMYASICVLTYFHVRRTESSSSLRILLTKTDGTSCRGAMLRLRSINPACFRLYSFTGLEGSRVNYYETQDRYALPIHLWIACPRLHATNYLRRDPSTNSLTFHLSRHHCLPSYSILSIHFHVHDTFPIFRM